VTIHDEHPFATPEGERDVLRRLRGRLPAAVTVLTAGRGRDRAGLTVTSLLLAAGEPARLLALVDEESELWDLRPETVVVNVLGPAHRYLADAFAGVAPAPGGPFTLGTWSDGPWGPGLDDAVARVGVRLDADEPDQEGWGLLLRGTVEQVELLDGAPLLHVRGRYVDGVEASGSGGRASVD
jgi:flavin reductase (DIM6/NTAB) family NADH-FMN oxidoreductase RutF